MIYSCCESFTVDLKHADVAYKIFDFWKAIGRDPQLKTTETMVEVFYTSLSITADKEDENELGGQ